MRIVSLKIGSFAGISGRTVCFDDGLNIIEGGNETGKSTVADFIRFLFYGFDRGEREKYTPFSGSACFGSAEIEKNGRIYTVERFDDGRQKRSAIFLDGVKVETGYCAGEFFTGLPDAALFSSVLTASDPKPRAGGTVSAVQNILSGGGESIDAERAAKALDKYRVDLRAKRGGGGRLNSLESTADSLRAEADRIKSREAEAAGCVSQIDALKRRLNEISVEQSRARQDRVTYLIGQRRRESGELKELRSRAEDLRAGIEKAESAHAVNDRAPDINDAAKMRTASDRVQEAGDSLDNAEKELAEQELLFSEAEKLRDRAVEERAQGKAVLMRRQRILSAAAYTALGLFNASLALTLVVFFARLSSTARIAFPVLAVISVAVFIFLILRVNGVRRNIAKLDDLSEYDGALSAIGKSLDEAETKAGVYRNILRSAETNLENLRTTYRLGEDDPAGELERYVSDLNRIREEYAGLNSEYIRRKSEYDSKAQDDSRTPADDGREIILPDGYDDGTYDMETDRLRDESKRIDGQITELRVRISSIEGCDSAEKVAELLRTEEEISALKEKYEAVLIAQQALDSAVSELRTSVVPRIKQSASAKMSVLTSGKYASLGVDGSLAVTFTPSDGAGGSVIRDERYMSSGTADCSYISLRLAMAELISDGEPLPVIFDETLNHLDMRRMLACLEMLSGGGQVLLFTASDRERRTCEAASIPHRTVFMEETA